MIISCCIWRYLNLWRLCSAAFFQSLNAAQPACSMIHSSYKYSLGDRFRLVNVYLATRCLFDKGLTVFIVIRMQAS